MAIKQINAKFGKMRKAVDWVVYPLPEGVTEVKELKLQSDHRCIIIDTATKKGILSPHVANYPRFFHCLVGPGREEVEVSQEIIDEAKAAIPKKGDAIGGGVVMG